MRAMIKSNPTSGYSILLVPENDGEKELLDKRFYDVCRDEIVKVDTVHFAGRPAHEVHLRLVGQGYGMRGTTQTDADVAFNHQAIDEDSRKSER